MPYADSNGYDIYYEIEGHGSPLLLHHGLTMTIDDWRDIGYVKALEKDYKLILMSPLGHGLSDKPHQSCAYTSYRRVSDIVSVLDQLNIQKTQMLGYSLGGRAALEMMAYAPDRIVSAAIGGSGPALRNPSRYSPMQSILEKGMDSWIDMVKRTRWPATPKWESRARANDLQALFTLLSTPMESLRNPLKANKIPALFYIGNKDFNYDLVSGHVEDLQNSEKLILEGLDHVEGFSQIHTVIHPITDFLRRTAIKKQFC